MKEIDLKMKGHPHPTQTMTDLYLWLGMDYQSEDTADNHDENIFLESLSLATGLTTRVAPSYLSNKDRIQD